MSSRWSDASGVSPTSAGLMSAFVPGLGQIRAGNRDRGVAVLAIALAVCFVTAWVGQRWLWLLVAPFWIAQILDAATVAAGRRPRNTTVILLAAVPIYVSAWQATEASVDAIVSGIPKVQPLFRGLMSPDFLTRASLEDVTERVVVYTPCPAEGAPAPGALSDDAPSMAVDPGCAPLGAAVSVTGAGWPADSPIEVVWRNPTGERSAVGEGLADGQGRFEIEIVIPESSIPLNVRQNRPDLPQRQSVEVVSPGPPGPLRPSDTLGLILKHVGVTIALGYMATVLGALLAVPFAVLGARNLMSANRITFAVYLLARTAMNVMRSIEPLILAVVFVVWVSQGPFAGVLALTVHTVAALGKLFSESIEDIDPGPVEAVRATGANWLQTVSFAVLPQVVPPFIAYTVYRWDINVRMSTIVGFVGGGGIGFLLSQWILKGDWREAATAVLVIAVVVIALDFVSAGVRQRITDGRPLFPDKVRPVALVMILLFTVWAWRTAGIEPTKLVTGLPKIGGIMGELLHPTLVARDTEVEHAEAPLFTPCSLLAESVAPRPQPAPDLTEPYLLLDETCADAGQILGVQGVGFSPDAPGRLRWRLPDGRDLGAGSVRSDADGAFLADVEVRPLLSNTGQETGEAIVVEAGLERSVGPPRPSDELKVVVDALVLTVLMALLATTIGAVFAMPLAFTGARNIMPRTLVGNAVYYFSRMFMNVLRAVEPLILAAIFASWVGYGTPWAGVLAITFVTVANLGKLFSEAVESIEDGPVEAIEATGASKPQTIAYGVSPQVVPPFLSFGIYQWDINVRISTVVGFVGGGGIGFILREWMNQLQWSDAAVAIIGIIVVVWSMDYLSAKIRERVREGRSGPAQGLREPEPLPSEFLIEAEVR